MLSFNAFDVVKAFELKVAEYTGAPYAIAVDSCSNAILLALFLKAKPEQTLFIPKNTYISVPMAAVMRRCKIYFTAEKWKGAYCIDPTKVYDAAKRFTKDMYLANSTMCLSFHGKKILGIGRGGMILTNSGIDAEWYRRARFDGRTEGVPHDKDKVSSIGFHCYMTPELAAAGLNRMLFINDYNEDQPTEYYGDMSLHPVFSECQADIPWPQTKGIYIE